jgi:hypothetical protein
MDAQPRHGNTSNVSPKLFGEKVQHPAWRSVSMPVLSGRGGSSLEKPRYLDKNTLQLLKSIARIGTAGQYFRKQGAYFKMRSDASLDCLDRYNFRHDYATAVCYAD